MEKPIDVIFKKFDEDNNSQISKTSEHIKNVFNNEDAFKSCVKAAKDFLYLLPKLLNNRNYFKRLEDLKKNIQENINILNNKENTDLNNDINLFLNFVIDKKRELSLLLTPFKSQLKITPTDEALLEGVDGEIYTYSVLKTKFKSRLRSQDRVSGDKIWLPLRFIAKIYAKMQGKKENDYLKWLNSLVNSICIHFYNENNEITHVSFGIDVSLLLKKGDDENKEKYNVFVRFKDNEEVCQVLTPTGRGNEKKEMQVTGINSIAIDHVIPIDNTLRDLENKLKMLELVSNEYKKLQDQDEPNENATIQRLLNKSEFRLEDLTNNLNDIMNHGPLRLMAAEYNSKKSNGETFSKIVKKDNVVWGILTENIYNEGNDNQKMTLCQELTNIKDKNGILCVFPENKIKGDDVTKEYISAKYIDFI